MHGVVPANGSGFAGPMTGSGGDPYAVTLQIKEGVSGGRKLNDTKRSMGPRLRGDDPRRGGIKTVPTNSQ